MYPIMLDLRNKPVLVVGAGKIAYRKVVKLLEQGADVTVMSRSFSQLFEGLPVRKIQKEYSPQRGGYSLIFACTNETKTNARIKEIEGAYAFVNNVSDKYNSDFYNVASMEIGDVSVHISTYGESPSRAKQIKEDIYHYLEGRIDESI